MFHSSFGTTCLLTTLIVAPRYVVAGPDLAELMRREQVTNAIITPAVLATPEPAHLPALRVLGVGGEAVRPDLVDAWAPGRLMRNGYGPTETTATATIHVDRGDPLDWDSVPIGGPLGAARLAQLALHQNIAFSDLLPQLPLEQAHRPDAERFARYAPRRETFRQIYQQLLPLMS